MLDGSHRRRAPGSGSRRAPSSRCSFSSPPVRRRLAACRRSAPGARPGSHRDQWRGLRDHRLLHDHRRDRPPPVRERPPARPAGGSGGTPRRAARGGRRERRAARAAGPDHLLQMDLLPVRILGRDPGTSPGRSESTRGRTTGCGSGCRVVAAADGAGALAGSVRLPRGRSSATVRLVVDARSSVVAIDQETAPWAWSRGSSAASW